MPVWLLRAFEEEKPRIEAREAIQAANITAAATGNMKKQDRTRMLNAWRREANRGIPVQKLGYKATAEKFGIPVFEEKKPDV